MNQRTFEALQGATDAALAALDAAAHFTAIGQKIQASIAAGEDLSDAELDAIHAETGAQLAAARARAEARLAAETAARGG